MARKGSHPKSGVDRGATKTKHNGVLDQLASDATSKSSLNGENIPEDKGPMDGNANTRFITPSGNNGKGSKRGSLKKNGRGGVVNDREKSEVKTQTSGKLNSSSNKPKDVEPGFASNDLNKDLGISDGHNHISECTDIHNGETEDDIKDKLATSVKLAVKHLSILASQLIQIANMWVERQKPVINSFTATISNAHNNFKIKIMHVYPIVRSWIFHIGKILFLLSMVWLDSSWRGLGSLLHLGTTSFFVIIWSSFFSILAMIGITKMLIVMVIASLLGVFIGLGIAILMTAISSAAILLFYGSFWMTMLVVVLGGAAFGLSHERLALFLTTMYSLYCVHYYMGWLGLFLGLNLSFISSDVLISFLRNNTENQESNIPPEEATFGTRSDHFYTESMHASATTDSSSSAFGRSAEHDAGAASTSGSSAEITSEAEVIRLLNCSDHYSALGLARYESIDVSSLKREYRKKAMLVHPDKNMGNEKAAEAFKKLQNAYEVLLDSSKRKPYDDELRRQEILNYFRRFQSIPRKNGRNGGPGLYQDSSGEGSTEESRRIACKKCGDFHVWIRINKSKSRARWCQDCKDFHHAKDGDGWVEQSFQPLMFGILHKLLYAATKNIQKHKSSKKAGMDMDPPHAYVCADSKIYDATEWFVCQGMRCPANSHKPTFHINTSVTSSKHNAKGSHGAGETMTEEEFFEWLQNAMQSGSFEATGSAPGESPSAKAGGVPKNSSKKKRKGKKAW